MKIRSKHIIYALIFIVFSAGAALGSVFYLQKNKTITLELGMFVDSNWEMSQGDNYRIIDTAIAKFEKTHPHVRIHYYSGIRKCDYEEWFSQQVLLGKIPDVAMILNSQFNKLAAMHLLKNLDNMVQADASLKKTDYFTGAWNSGMYRNALYALPYEVNFMLMAVNKTLLDRHGCALPGKNWTWNDFYSLCKKMTADKNGDFALDSAGVCRYTWQQAVYSNNARLFDDAGKKSFFSNPNVVESVRFMQNLTSLTEEQIFTQQDFDEGKVAFMPLSFAEYRMYTSYPYKITKNLDYEWRYLTMPAGFAGSNVSEMDTLLMGISAYTKHAQYAYELLKTFVYDNEIQTALYRYANGASALRRIAVSDEAMRLLTENMDTDDKQYNSSLLSYIMNYSIVPPKFQNYEEHMVFADTKIKSIIAEKKDAGINLQSLQQTVQTRLEKQ